MKLLPRLQEALAAGPRGEPTTVLRELVRMQLDQLPLPGGGHTLDRWRALAAVAVHDLSLLKLYEGHTDALATWSELRGEGSPRGTLGLFAAEPPGVRVELEGSRVRGTKAWCSGAAGLDYALLTAWRGDEGPYLALVPLQHDAVRIDESGWKAVGMAGTRTATVHFEGVEAVVLGARGEYLSRPGFWHGAAGIAACWYGAAVSLGNVLRRKARGASAGPHLLAHLGAVESALLGARSALQHAARRIDAESTRSGELVARGVRAVVEDAVETVLRHTGRALGAGPFCTDERFARQAADLGVFMRQSHAESDLEALGRCTAREEESWVL